MIPTERPLDNPINWSFRAGRVWGIDVRIHVTFLIGAVVLLWMQLPKPGQAPVPLLTVLGETIGTYLILFAIVLLHEFGHCWGARTTGGEAEQILLWPLGGLAQVNPVHHPRAHLVTTVAGPMVNVAICAVCSGILTLWMGSLGAVPWNPLHPTTPLDPMIFPTVGQAWVLRAYGISYFLLLINLLPVFPFDGGRVLQAILWSRRGFRIATEIATATGMIGAVVIALFGLFTDQSWLMMMIAVFGYVTCWQTRQALRDQPTFGFGAGDEDFGDAATLEAARPRRANWWQRRRARRAAAQALQERRREEQHQARVEAVLAKVSQGGLTSLTPEDRAVLEEETRRKRALRGDPDVE